MSEEGFVRFAAMTYALDEAIDARNKEEEEEEERERRLRDSKEEEWSVTKSRQRQNPKRAVPVEKKPDPRLVVDPAIRELLSKPR